MSLNGLDTLEIQDAYQAAVVEAGGWFLLKYISRDAVELLGRGKGGVHEARNGLAKYEERSPLYGVLIYRRRKVLIKFVPEGTSRLLRARTAVHFQDVTERFQPYETLLEIEAANGLNDTSLAAAFPLHTASPSASSRRLHEISEDGEEGGPAFRHALKQRPTSSRPERTRAERRVEQLIRSQPMPPIIHISRDASPPPILSPPKTSVSQFLVREESGHRSITSLSSSRSVASVTEYAPSESSRESAESGTSTTEPTRSTLATAPSQTLEHRSYALEKFSPEREEEEADDSSPAAPEKDVRKSSTAPRLSEIDRTPRNELPSATVAPHQPEKAGATQDLPEKSSVAHYIPERPSEQEHFNTDEIYWSKYEPKPKVRLGPRLVSKDTKRPTVASVSGMPANYRLQPKKVEASRSISQGPPSAVSMPVHPPPPPIPAMPEYTPRPISRGSVKSLPSHRSSTMTPDKIRLLKAVERRKRQLRNSNPNLPEPAPPTEKSDDIPEVPKITTAPEPEPQNPQVDTGVEWDPEKDLERAQKKAPDADSEARDESHCISNKADSGIEMQYERPDERDHEPSSETEPHAEPVLEQKKEPASPTILFAQRDSPDLDDSRRSVRREAEPTYVLPTQSMNSELPPNLSEMESAEIPLGRAHPPGLDEALNQDTPPRQATSSPIPRTQPEDDTRPQISSGSMQVPPINVSDEPEESAVANEGATSSNLADTPARNPRRKDSDSQKKRRGFVEPLHLDMSSVSHDGADYLSDEDFMEELQSATFQDAKSISVQKSPAAGYFPRQPGGTSVHSIKSRRSGHSIRSSSQLENFLSSPPDRLTPQEQPPSQGGRSQSMSLLNTPELGKGDPPSTSRNMTVSSGISRRIQALAELSSRETSPRSHDHPLTPEASPNMPTRNPSLRDPPKSRTRSAGKTRRSSTKANAWPTPVNNPGATSTPAVESTSAVWNVQHDPTTLRDSVSVTARIVRKPLDSQQNPAQSSKGSPLELQESQLVINHRLGTPSQTSIARLPSINTNPTPLRRYESTPSMVSLPLPSSPVSPIATRSSTDNTRTLHSASRRSFGRHRRPEPIEEALPSPPAQRSTSSNSLTFAEEKNRGETSRTSRFFKRISGMGGGSKRRSIAQTMSSNNSPPNSVDVTRHNSIASRDKSDMPPAAVVGNLNVQFPDFLLWKRRWVEIDSQGYIIFSIPQAMEHQRGIAKRFHLSEFKRPYTPDLDRQELPHSVLLDFVDGTTLQAACEDGMMQQQVLSVLRTYHKAWIGA